MSNFEEHLTFRTLRYNTFVNSSHFNKNLKGLHHIDLNVIENCTRKCSFCPRSNSEIYPKTKHQMTFDTFKSIITNCKNYSYKEEIHFTGFGESLLHPLIINFLEYIREQGLDNFVSITTNGDLFSKYEPKHIYQSGADHITVSCYDGQDQYDHFVNILSSHNKSFLVRKLWSNTSNFLKTNSFVERNLEQKQMQRNCYIPSYKLFIDYDGRILLCNNDWFRKQNLNLNINKNTLLEIWFSESLSKVRADLNKNLRINPACSTCNVNGLLLGKESKDLLVS